MAPKISGSGLANLPFVSNCDSPLDVQRRVSKKLDIALAVFCRFDLENPRYRESAPSLGGNSQVPSSLQWANVRILTLEKAFSVEIDPIKY